MNQEPQNIFMYLGNQGHLTILQNIEANDVLSWTCRQEALKSDIAAICLTYPISSIIGFGKIYRKPWKEDQSEWQDKWFAEIIDFKMFEEEEFLSIRSLKDLFTEWKYLVQPRQSGIAPQSVVIPLRELQTASLKKGTSKKF